MVFSGHGKFLLSDININSNTTLSPPDDVIGQ